VLPYRRILNSGTVLLALTFDRPVLVPDLGSMPDLQKAFGTDWIRLYAGELTTAELAGAIDWARATGRRAVDLDRFDWRAIARRTLEVYAAILSRRLPGEQVRRGR
jgi:beta-1,4-mannosyltransferase